MADNSNCSGRGANAVIKGAALGLALIEAAALQARPVIPEGVRTNASNTPVATVDSYQAGRGLLGADDVIGAMAAFRQALVDTPQSVDVLNALGVCYDRLGRYDLSRTYYDTALSIEPTAPLVLNNLGYSLYLQGRYQAAIPVLQQITGSPDPAIAASGRRVLALVAARVRDSAALASHREGLAEASGDSYGDRSARIETAASGEQRLVIGGPAPDRELVASLGDAAALVMVAKPWTEGDQRRLIRRQQTEDRAVSLAGAEDLAALAAPASPVLVSLPAEVAEPARPAPIAMVLATVSPRLAAAAKAPAAARLVASDRIDPAWLLSSRRTGKAVDSIRTVAGQDPVTVVSAFDSDDATLNLFAARMRGGIADDNDVRRAAAIARLQALVVRVRSA